MRALRRSAAPRMTLSLRAGVAHGPVIWTGGTTLDLDQDLQGCAPDLATRLARTARPWELLVPETLHPAIHPEASERLPTREAPRGLYIHRMQLGRRRGPSAAPPKPKKRPPRSLELEQRIRALQGPMELTPMERAGAV